VHRDLEETSDEFFVDGVDSFFVNVDIVFVPEDAGF
jgi:hypothetical protein